MTQKLLPNGEWENSRNDAQQLEIPLSDIYFAINDTYKVGQKVEVKIKNRGNRSYVYNPRYEACDLQYYDEFGRTFIIPPGTHCDIEATAEIKAGETKTLFTWKLDECIEDNWGCAKSKPLKPGKYTIKGNFGAVESWPSGQPGPNEDFNIIAKAEKTITVVSQ